MKIEKQHGGRRKGAGRPKLEVIKVPAKPPVKWLAIGVTEQFWQAFCEAASSAVEDGNYERLAELVLVDGMHRYIDACHRQAKKQAKA